MEEIKRRTLMVRIFPNAAACLRPVRALAVGTHESWIEAMQYLNMDPLRAEKKEKPCESWEMRHEDFYRATRARRSQAALALPHEFAELDKHNYIRKQHRRPVAV